MRTYRLIFFTFLLSFSLFPPSLSAWVAGTQSFPDGQATVILHQFCLTICESVTPSEWHSFIQKALGQWDTAGSTFRFDTRPAHSTDDPCLPPLGTVSVILIADRYMCPQDGLFPSSSTGGATAHGPGERAVVYLFVPRDRFVNRAAFLRYIYLVMLHEFGHVLGLNHPDEAGQQVSATMNSNLNVEYRVAAGTHREYATLQPDDIAGVRALYGVHTATAAQQSTLESPAAGQTVTGVGLLSGWACNATTVSVRFDERGDRIPVPVGGSRKDTESVCGHADTGFALLLNWNNFGAGDHTFELFIDGQLSTSRTVTVIDYGTSFLRGVTGTWVLDNWPEPGINTTVAWNEATQNIEIVDIHHSGSGQEEEREGEQEEEGGQGEEPEPEEEQPTTADLAACRGWDTSQFTEYTFRDFTAEWVRQCLEAGANPHARDRYGRTPLHYVAEDDDDNPAAVRLLIQYGADVNVRSNGDVTPLHLAASWADNLAIVLVLLEAGANPNAQDADGETPLFYHDNFGLNPEIERALVNAGADPNIHPPGEPIDCSTPECAARLR